MPLTRGGKVFVGCLAGCFTLVMMAGIAGFIGYRWLKTPGPPLEGMRLLDERAAVYGEVRLRFEDPGMKELVRGALEESRRPRVTGPEEISKPLQYILGSIPQRQVSDKDLQRVLPIVVSVVSYGGAGEKGEEPLFAISFAGAGNSLRIADWFMGRFKSSRDDDFENIAYGQERIYVLGKKDRPDRKRVFATIVGTDVLFAFDEAPVKAAIDNLATTAPGAPAAVPEPFASRPEGSVIFLGAREGHAMEIAGMVEKLSPALAAPIRDLLDGAGSAYLWTRMSGPDVMEGELRVALPGSAGAPAAAPGEPPVPAPPKAGAATAGAASAGKGATAPTAGSGASGGAEGAGPAVAAADAPAGDGTVASVEIGGHKVSLAVVETSHTPAEKGAWKIRVDGLNGLARAGLQELGERQSHRLEERRRAREAEHSEEAGEEADEKDDEDDEPSDTEDRP